MGPLILPERGPVYIDTATLIYRIERVEPYLSASAPLWDALGRGTHGLVTSELTLLEALVKPLRDGNSFLVGVFRQVLLRTTGLACMPVSLAIVERAARLRADLALRTPDAIHAATAIESGCSMLVTNDASFRRIGGLDVVLLSEVV